VSRSLVALVLVALTFPTLAAPKRRAVEHPAPLTDDAIIAIAAKVADRVTWTFHPRLHWENAVYFDSLVLLGEELNRRNPGSGDPYLDKVANVLLNSDDPIETVWWGDGTAFGQATLDLYRVLPPSDPRRDALLTKLTGPLQFAQHAVRVTPADAAPRDPWWMPGGYGARFWQDDLYMVVPWLSHYPNNELARNLAYEWIESYLYDHRPTPNDVIPSLRSRRGALLFDATSSLFIHEPNSSVELWGRGNAWALIALLRAAESLDAPYTGGRYDQVITTSELRDILRNAAQSLIARRTPDGGWGSFLVISDNPCTTAETSATALITFFLARTINDGLIDRDVYTPIVNRAYELLLRRVDANGYVEGVQPPGIGPTCAQQSSNSEVNVNYAPGAFLLATAEILKSR